MFSGESVPVVFRVRKIAVNHVLDWFGTEVKFCDETEDEVTAIVTVNTQAMKYWAMQYGDYVRVISPRSLADDIINSLRQSLEWYTRD